MATLFNSHTVVGNRVRESFVSRLVNRVKMLVCDGARGRGAEGARYWGGEQNIIFFHGVQHLIQLFYFSPFFDYGVDNICY